MCGIAGIWTNRLAPDFVREKVARMTACMAHRGPDDSGIATSHDALATAGGSGASVAFGHRRLSIVDLSAAGHQPMHDPATGNWITFNGEIYNFTELRAELLGRGHVFASQCDTEVILKAYAEWDLGCWRRLRGIFAFGLWDARRAQLHLVRDHLGIKPLYFARTSAGLAFASEVRAILAADWVERQLSSAGLASYLKYGSVQEPCTMIDGVESLPPGGWMMCEPSGQTATRQFWRMTECLVRNWERPPSRADVGAQLEDSVRRQLVADVPVGVFLSGGLDSTAIAALAARACPGAIHTFCIGSDEPDFDESREAAATAAALGCIHSTLVLEARTVREQFSRAIGSYDQPSADGLNTYFISKLVREAGIKVALSGLGGDELFVGYAGFQKGFMLEKIGRGLGVLSPGVRGLLSRGITAASVPGSAVFGAIGEVMEPGLPAPYFASRTHFSLRHAQRLLAATPPRRTEAALWQRREAALAGAARDLEPVNRVSFLELQTYMLSTLLRDADQMSMAHGLELRVPLIDPEIVEHVLPIPQAEKFAGGQSKRVLIDALGDLIPREVFARRKRGFMLPFQRWFFRDLGDTLAECFHRKAHRGPWDHAAFLQVWRDFQLNRVGWSRVLALFTLESWLEEHRIAV